MTPHEETSVANAAGLDTVVTLMKRRRTNLLMDRERSVDDALVEQLLDLITWAPNHKRTWPWQIAVFTGTSRATLGEACTADLLAETGAGVDGVHVVVDEAKVVKTRSKYTRSPVVVAVGQIGFSGNDDAHRVGEDRDAVAAGIQNFLLGATAAGLASYWGSAAYPTGTALLDCCGFEPTSRVNALIYLGWPSTQPEPPLRPALPISWHR
jgi:nitroreductase